MFFDRFLPNVSARLVVEELVDNTLAPSRGGIHRCDLLHDIALLAGTHKIGYAALCGLADCEELQSLHIYARRLPQTSVDGTF